MYVTLSNKTIFFFSFFPLEVDVMEREVSEDQDPEESERDERIEASEHDNVPAEQNDEGNVLEFKGFISQLFMHVHIYIKLGSSGSAMEI